MMSVSECLFPLALAFGDFFQRLFFPPGQVLHAVLMDFFQNLVYYLLIFLLLGEQLLAAPEIDITLEFPVPRPAANVRKTGYHSAKVARVGKVAIRQYFKHVKPHQQEKTFRH